MKNVAEATDAELDARALQQENGSGVYTPGHIQWAHISGWDAQPVPERDWLIRDHIPLRQPTLFSGEGAVGKTLVTLHLQAAIALGREWLGMLPEQGGAWYLGAEDDEQELHIRLNGIRQHFAVSYAELANSGFQMKSLFGEDAVLGAPNRSTGLIEPTRLFHQLYEEAADTKPKSIAFDASADVFAGNEIDRLQVRQFVGLLRKLAGAANAAIILLSHPSLTGISSGTGLSGSTAWHNSVRARMYLTSPKPEAGEQPDSDLRELAFKKNNYGPKGNSIILRYQNGLFLPERGMSTLERAEHDMRVDNSYLDGLRKLLDQGQATSPQVQSPHYVPRLIAANDKSVRLKDLEASQQRLLDSRRIHIASEGKPSRPVRRLFLGSGLSEGTNGGCGDVPPTPPRTEGAGGGHVSPL